MQGDQAQHCSSNQRNVPYPEALLNNARRILAGFTFPIVERDPNKVGDDYEFDLTIRFPDTILMVRLHGLAEQPWRFTLRDRDERDEYALVTCGRAEWLFYGHANRADDDLELWSLIDLHGFRAALINQSEGGAKIRSGDFRACDGTRFRWFDLHSFQPPILIGAGGILPQLKVVGGANHG